MGKDTISWAERMFCSSIIDYLIRIDGASYLNGYRSLMFLMHVFKCFFYKSEKKHVLMFFFICKVLFLTSMTYMYVSLFKKTDTLMIIMKNTQQR